MDDDIELVGVVSPIECELEKMLRCKNKALSDMRTCLSTLKMSATAMVVDEQKAADKVLRCSLLLNTELWARTSAKRGRSLFRRCFPRFLTCVLPFTRPLHTTLTFSFSCTMVRSTIIVRASDALPLAASVDDEEVSPTVSLACVP